MNKTINLIISWIEQWEMFLPPRSQEEGGGVFQDRHWDLSCLHSMDVQLEIIHGGDSLKGGWGVE